MKSVLGILLCLVLTTIAVGSAEKLQCKLPAAEVPQQWISMVDSCTNLLKAQVQEELTAAMTYLAMGAHFSRDSVNRPGFAKMFFKAASEERQHAIKVIEYLLMRGGLVDDISELIRNPRPNKTEWKTALEALKDALNLETYVTDKIRAILIECENPATKNFNDYHLVDHFTAEFLDEQYQGQRDLAGKISTLGKMMNQHGILGEFLYDKKILEELS